MYNKIQELHNKIGTVQFAMAVSHLLQKGVDIMKKVSDKDIKSSGDNFAQTVNTDTRELARIIDDDPICLILYCMSKEIFDVNSLLPFEEQIISKVIWKNKDVISIYKEVSGVTPTEEQLQEVLDNIYYDSLDDCSHGWEVIAEAVRETKGEE